jgi:hypothetical protein
MRNLIRIAAFLVGLLVAVSAPATTLVHLSLEQLSQASSDVVRGHAVSQQVGWNDSHTQILTFTTVEIEQTLKGTPRATVVIEQPGGAVGNLRVRVPGTVSFRRGVSYYLFLEPAAAGAGNYLVTGMVQGAYRIYRQPQTGEERVIRPFGSLFRAQKASRANSPALAQTASVREFLREVSEAMAAPLVIPKRTSIPVAIRSSEKKGGGGLRVSAVTTATVYPNRRAIVPAGSLVEGTARLSAGRWKIHWSEVSVRGKRASISAGNEVAAGGPLAGRMLVLNLR